MVSSKHFQYPTLAKESLRAATVPGFAPIMRRKSHTYILFDALDVAHTVLDDIGTPNGIWPPAWRLEPSGRGDYDGKCNLHCHDDCHDNVKHPCDCYDYRYTQQQLSLYNPSLKFEF